MNTHNKNNKKGRTKLSRRALDLLIELRKYESSQNMRSLAGGLDQMGPRLVRLYRTTESLRSRGVIAELLAEMGYPWFPKFAREMINGNLTSEHVVPKQKAPEESHAKTIKTSPEPTVPNSLPQSTYHIVVSKGDFLEMEPDSLFYN